jgi:hypothetical protein
MLKWGVRERHHRAENSTQKAIQNSGLRSHRSKTQGGELRCFSFKRDFLLKKALC